MLYDEFNYARKTKILIGDSVVGLNLRKTVTFIGMSWKKTITHSYSR